MLTLSEFSFLAREIEKIIKDDIGSILKSDKITTWWKIQAIKELMLDYTDLSSEDDEFKEELDERFFEKLKTE
jgi:hypothetical protein